MKRLWLFASLLLLAAMMLAACQPAATATPTAEPAPADTVAPAPTDVPGCDRSSHRRCAEEFIFGMLLVGPYNDHGWSQAHYDGGMYVEAKLPGAKMIYIDKVNTADRPGTTPAQLAEDLVSKGAKLIIFNSDDMKDRRS